jgi:membrane-bound ClpP family serine protease
MFYVGLFVLLLIGVTLAAVAVRSRQLKFRPSGNSLLSASGVVTHSIDPTGAILINGELFFATSGHGEVISSSTNVKVVGSNNHQLLVIPQEPIG